MKRDYEGDPAMPGASAPCKARPVAVLRQFLVAAGLVSAPLSSGDGLGSASAAQTVPSLSAPSATPATPTLDSLISVLQANGFTAERVELPPPFNGGIRTHLTGYPKVPAYLGALLCNAPAPSVCFLGFVSLFPKAPVLAPDKLATLDAMTLAHVRQLKDGDSNTLTIEYTYACKDIADPGFVLMVMRYFTAAVRQVLTSSQQLTGPSAAPAMPDSPASPR